jgi:para-aminobenzoate synthetase component 1
LQRHSTRTIPGVSAPYGSVTKSFFGLLSLTGEISALCQSRTVFDKKGTRIVSQPIKGTIQRNLASEAEDEKLKESLRLSPKEQAENVMIVDLVRNDLTRVCKPASVEVEELFGIYSFPQVHQMISTISGEQKDGVTFSQLLEATFPMGSMTGAPKLRVMQLIDEYEPSARGIFSGSVGYKAPNGDFDFNVVIRSIMYNQAKGHLVTRLAPALPSTAMPKKSGRNVC